MSSIEFSERDKFINLIAGRTIGDLWSWTAPRLEKTVGPFFPDAFSDYENRVATVVAECKLYMSLLSDDELLNGFHSSGRAKDDTYETWQDEIGSRASSVKRDEPHWCPSSYKGHQSGLSIGGSGSFV